MVKIKHPPRGFKRKHDDIQVSSQQTPDVKPDAKPDVKSSENCESPAEIRRDGQGNNQEAINRDDTVVTAQERQTSG